MEPQIKFILLALVLCYLYYLINAILDYLLFKDNLSFLQVFIAYQSIGELYSIQTS